MAPTRKRFVNTYCPYCALQCPMLLTQKPGSSVEATERGAGMCKKGWTSPDILDHPDRLTNPLLHGKPVAWDTAYDYIVEQLRSVWETKGREGVGVFGSGALTNEKAYQLGKWARIALQTPFIDYNGRFCMSSAATALNRSLGLDRGLPFPSNDLVGADVVVLVGANPAETMPPFMRNLVRPKLVVIDPRYTATAEQADLFLQPKPGTDMALANGLLHIAIEQDHIDRDYIAKHTTGFNAVRAEVSEAWPAVTERLTGVPIDELYRLENLMYNQRTTILTARGSEQHADGVDTVTAWINLALALGLVGKPSSGYGCLTGQGNGQGGREHGQKADQLPGYRSIANEQHREHTARVWGVDPDSIPGAGVSAVELIRKCGNDIGMMFVAGSNPVVSAPNAIDATQRFKDLDCLVVMDFFMSQTAELADVVLPVKQWAEEEGTMTNLEGRIQRRKALNHGPTNSRSELQILADIASRLGEDALGSFSANARTVFEELKSASKGGKADYSGSNWDDLEDNPIQWPVTDENPEGTPRVFTDFIFPTADGKAHFIPVRPRRRRENADTLWLTTGRVLTQYQSGVQTSRIPQLNVDPFVDIHPDTAARLDIKPGALVEVTSPRGSFQAVAHFSPDIRRDTIFSPFHFPGINSVNRAVSDELDPISRMPEFKRCEVSLAPVHV